MRVLNMQESDLPEFASPSASVQLQQREEQKDTVPRLSESPEPMTAPPLPSPYHSSHQPPSLDPDFDDEESPTPLASVPQPMHSPYSQPAPPVVPAPAEDEFADQPSAPPAAPTTSEHSPYTQMKADVEVLDSSPVIVRRNKEVLLGQSSSGSKKQSPVSSDFRPERLVPMLGVEKEDEGEVSPSEGYTSISNIDSLLIDIHRYTVQTGGRVSAQLKSRISQCVGQFAVRAHNLPPPQVHSKVKKEIERKDRVETRDPLGQLNKAIEAFSVKVAKDIQRMKSPQPVTQVVSSAFLELLREVSNVNMLCHPHRTMWEVFLYFFQQPGAAVNYIRQLPKHIKEGAVSHSNGYTEQIDLVKVLLDEVASVDLYVMDTVGVTLALYNVTSAAVGYFDAVGNAPPKPAKEEFEPGRLSRKVMTTHGKFLAKVMTGTRSPRQFVPVRGKVPSPEEVPEPAVLPRPIAIE